MQAPNKLLSSRLLFLFTLTLLSLAHASSICTPTKRLAIAAQIPYAYNVSPISTSAVAFKEVPFASDCTAFIFPNGGPDVPVAINGKTTYPFAVLNRQLFSEVTDVYTDVPEMNSAIIHTNVTLGVRDIVPVPITFSADVYLDFNLDCSIRAVRAYATIPTQVLGLILNPPSLSGLPLLDLGGEVGN